LPIATASFSPDGQALITGGFDGYLEEWDAATGERLRVLLDPCAQEDERPRVVCIEDGKEVEAPFQLVRLSESMRGSSILCVRFSPDGKIFVVGAANGDVVVWNSWSRGEMHAWRVHEHGVNALAVSPNGRNSRLRSTYGAWEAYWAKDLQSILHTTIMPAACLPCVFLQTTDSWLPAASSSRVTQALSFTAWRRSNG
jgi:WD40 repeat protein